MCNPAWLKEAAAYYDDSKNLLIITVKGEKSNACYSARIRKGPERILPPIFHLEQCFTAAPGTICIQKVEDFEITEVFQEPRYDFIYLSHQEGTTQVTVQDFGEESSEQVKAVASTATKTSSSEVVRGLSNASFEEAFQNAVKNLPPLDPEFPDQFVIVKVVEQGSLNGGIVGFMGTYYVDVIREG